MSERPTSRYQANLISTNTEVLKLIDEDLYKNCSRVIFCFDGRNWYLSTATDITYSFCLAYNKIVGDCIDFDLSTIKAVRHGNDVGFCVVYAFNGTQGILTGTIQYIE